MKTLEEWQYPIGKCVYHDEYTPALLKQYIADIRTFPLRLEHAVQSLSEEQLQTPYREGGWTIQQVIHHLADSHLNCLLRLKFALTEDNPTIKPYQEDLWAMTADYQLPFNVATTLLFAIHKKIVCLLTSLTTEQLQRTYYHAQYQRSFRIMDVMCLYAWHGNHHLAHITNAPLTS
jgi:uncharacterized damage-inducible protein DinB